MFDKLLFFLWDQVFPWGIGFLVFAVIITVWLVLREDEYEDEKYHPNFQNKYRGRK